MFFLIAHLANIGLIIDITGALLIFFNSPLITYRTIIYMQEEKEKLEKKAKKLVDDAITANGDFSINLGC
jgi:hypothetical protein